MRRAVTLGSIFAGFSSGAGGTFTVFHSSMIVWEKADVHNRQINAARPQPMRVDLSKNCLLNIFTVPPFQIHLSFLGWRGDKRFPSILFTGETGGTYISSLKQPVNGIDFSLRPHRPFEILFR
jgi:hypothetical protein